MPYAPPHTCPRHRMLVQAGQRCGKCKLEQQKAADARRPSAAKRLYGARWQELSKAFLRDHPWCAECERQGKRTLAECVDHVIPHKGDRGLFFDQGNWQSLDAHCHNRKTAREDGGWGNRRVTEC